MDYKNISAGELSSRLDVQRSNISHILNGRNKPGASFIEKLLLSFPDLNARWLFTGIGEMLDNYREKETVTSPVQQTIFTQNESNRSGANEETLRKIVTTNKEISKIVILYSDGTFTDFERE